MKTPDVRNLVVLMFSDDDNDTETVMLNDPIFLKENIKIDENNWTWTYPRKGLRKPAVTRIGMNLWGRGIRVIGIYDNTNIVHLHVMAAAREAVSGLLKKQAPWYKRLFDGVFPK